jgi:hypothetical protein
LDGVGADLSHDGLNDVLGVDVVVDGLSLNVLVDGLKLDVLDGGGELTVNLNLGSDGDRVGGIVGSSDRDLDGNVLNVHLGGVSDGDLGSLDGVGADGGLDPGLGDEGIHAGGGEETEVGLHDGGSVTSDDGAVLIDDALLDDFRGDHDGLGSGLNVLVDDGLNNLLDDLADDGLDDLLDDLVNDGLSLDVGGDGLSMDDLLVSHGGSNSYGSGSSNGNGGKGKSANGLGEVVDHLVNSDDGLSDGNGLSDSRSAHNQTRSANKARIEGNSVETEKASVIDGNSVESNESVEAGETVKAYQASIVDSNSVQTKTESVNSDQTRPTKRGTVPNRRSRSRSYQQCNQKQRVHC